MRLKPREHLDARVLQGAGSIMKPLVILIIAGALYGVVTMKAKTLAENMTLEQICSHKLTHPGCEALTLLHDSR